jgi:hypothetical protein
MYAAFGNQGGDGFHNQAPGKILLGAAQGTAVRPRFGFILVHTHQHILYSLDKLYNQYMD